MSVVGDRQFVMVGDVEFAATHVREVTGVRDENPRDLMVVDVWSKARSPYRHIGSMTMTVAEWVSFRDGKKKGPTSL